MIDILYFGTICDLNHYNELLLKCRQKPSVSTILFEEALMNGFKKNGANIEIYSFPMIPAFPTGRILYFGNVTEELNCGYSCTWLRTINVPILKQISRRLEAKRILKKWMKEKGTNGLILTYSVPPFLIEDLIAFKQQYGTKIIAIIPDLLRDMYINEKQNSVITSIKKRYILKKSRLQGEYDGYVYLTEAMKYIVAPEKPYVIMEGIVDALPDNEQIQSVEKSKSRSIMYAGMLHEKYGIMNLIDAFEQVDIPDAELWLFGEGTASQKVKARAEANTRIKYFGHVEHDTVVDYEKKAHILVNPRNPKDEFTFYSFPSKTIEYMLSGTPVLTTRLKGIPDEYFNYIFSARENSAEALTHALNDIFSHSEKELEQIGQTAKEFIIKEKNSEAQVKHIINLIEEVTSETKVK